MMLRHRGFTLIELAVALFIIALLMGSLLIPLSAQIDQKNYSETQQLLSEARESLMGYAMTHIASDGKPYLPCADTDNDGHENRESSGACAASTTVSNLPWSDLGLAAMDAWGNRLRYHVTPAFSNSQIGFALGPPATPGTLRICNAIPCIATATALPLVLISHGPNGAGAITQDGNTNLAPTNADEQENTNSNNDFVMHPPVQNGFDDIVVWIPATTLFNRMVTAGRLP